MPHQPTIDFAAGALPRTLWAAAFIIAVVVAVRLVSAVSTVAVTTSAVTAGATTVGDAAALEVDATYAVATWTVLVDGRAVDATASDGRRWRGVLPAGGECTVEATPADVLAGGAAALRARLTRDHRTRTIDAWGDGAAALRIPLADGR